MASHSSRKTFPVTIHGNTLMRLGNQSLGFFLWFKILTADKIGIFICFKITQSVLLHLLDKMPTRLLQLPLQAFL
jgi:hypothetical protein